MRMRTPMQGLIIPCGWKTSAQTGRYDEDGKDICHAWITGFFPVANPKYAVTVLVEDGGFGNDEVPLYLKRLLIRFMNTKAL